MKHLVSTILTVLFLLLFTHTTRAQDSTVQHLQEVTVTAAQPFIIQRTDKIILNIAQSPLAAGGNIYEAVKRVPGVIDIQGLQFRGREVTVYIDDKPIRLGGEELKLYLSTVPAGTVDRIEVLPHPSSKYEAAGGAVINIILAKNKDYGINGTLTAAIGAGKYIRTNKGFTLNYRSAKLSLTASYDRSHTKTLNTRTAQRMFSDSYLIDEDGKTLISTNSNTFRGGFDYTINPKSSFGMLIKGSVNNKDKDITNISRQHYYTQNPDSFSTVATTNHSRYFTPTVNLYYKTKAGKGDLSFNADYFSYAKDWNDDFTTRYTDATTKEYRDPFLLKDHSPARNKVRSLSVDYSFTKDNIQYETGLKTIFTRTDNDVAWEAFQATGWTNDATRSNHFIYDENIYAAYLTATRTIGKFNIQTGLRVEHTDTKGNSITLKQENKRNYTSLFPNLSLTYSPSDNQQFSLSYNRSIERFGFDIVNPFIIYQSQYAYYQGNPNILPSFSHNMELSWAWHNEWMAAFSYSHYTDVPAEIYKKDAGGNAMISTYENVSSADQINLNITHTKSLLNNHITNSNTLGILHAGYHAPVSTGLDNTSYTAYVSSDTRLLLGKNWRAEINMDYYSPMAFGGYRFQSQFDMGAGISKSWREGKTTLALNITDIFNTDKRRYTAASYGVSAINRENAETRFVKLAFTYKFGNSRVKAAGTRTSAIEEIKNRMSN